MPVHIRLATGASAHPNTQGFSPPLAYRRLRISPHVQKPKPRTVRTAGAAVALPHAAAQEQLPRVLGALCRERLRFQ